MKLVIGITGSTGVIYGVRLLENTQAIKHRNSFDNVRMG